MNIIHITNVDNTEIYSLNGHGKDYRICLREEHDSYVVSLWVENIGEWKDFIYSKQNKTDTLNKVKLILTPII